MTELNEGVVSTYLWWMKERQAILQRRRAGLPKPWSDHPVMQTISFCNVFREDDRTTIWLREHLRGYLSESPHVFLATHIFRRFNFIPTGQILLEAGLFDAWDSAEAIKLLRGREKVFTGAFMISSPNGKSKLDEICYMIDRVECDIDAVVSRCEACTTLEALWEECRFEHHTGLMAYELCTDLRHTYLGRDSTDIRSWAYFGPGAQRGVMRVLGRHVEGAAPSLLGSASGQALCLEVAQQMLAIVEDALGPADAFRGHPAPAWELRDIESGFCELGKLLTVCEGGRARRQYDGV